MAREIDYLRPHCSQLLLHDGWGYLAQRCEEWGVAHKRLPLNRLWKWPAGFALLIQELRRFRPNIVVTHGQWVAPLGALAARAAGSSRLVHTAHFCAFHTDWDFYRVVRNRLCELIPCRCADRVITLSRSTTYQYLLRRLTSPDRVVCIPNGVDLEAVPSAEKVAALRRQHGWDMNSCHVVSVGRLDQSHKHGEWLLKAWRLVQDTDARARLWIVGSGPDERLLQRMAMDLGLDATCRFLGAQPNGMDYMAAADIVAMTSLFEAQGLVPIEAMACGRPVVANDVDGVRDSFTDGCEGFLVPPFDYQRFAERLLTLIRSPDLRQKMGEAGRISARRFDHRVLLQQRLSLYQSLLPPPS